MWMHVGRLVVLLELPTTHLPGRPVTPCPLRVCSRDIVERDERRLADLGRRTVEMFAAAHIASTRLEAAWAEAETIKRQDELIREEEQQEREEEERTAQRLEVGAFVHSLAVVHSLRRGQLESV